MAKLSYTPSEADRTMSGVKMSYIDSPGTWGTTKFSAGESILSNLRTEDGTKYSVRYAINDVNNIFAGTDIEPANAGAVRKGKSLLVKVRHTGRLMENVGTAEEPQLLFKGEYPVEVGITCKFPNAVVDAYDVRHVVTEAMTALLGDSASTTDEYAQLTKLMSGSFPIK